MWGWFIELLNQFKLSSIAKSLFAWGLSVTCYNRHGMLVSPCLDIFIYINDLDKLNISGGLFILADNTFAGNSWADVYQKDSRDLSVGKVWFDQNILTLNVLYIKQNVRSKPPAHARITLHSCGNEVNTVWKLSGFRMCGTLLIPWNHNRLKI